MEKQYHTEIAYLTVDTINASLSEEISSRIPESTDFRLKADEPINLSIFLDRCVVEVFVNDRAVLMQHVYPTLEDSAGISVTAIGGKAAARQITIWDMNSIYTET